MTIGKLRLGFVLIVLLLAAGMIIAAPPRASACPTCAVPNNEQSYTVGVDQLDLEYDFKAQIWESSDPSYSFNGLDVEEEPEGNPYATDNCWWNGADFGSLPVLNGHWVVGEGEVSGLTNYWGYDEIGFSSAQINDIQYYGPAAGIKLPCVLTVHQAMQIECDASLFWQYDSGNTLTSTVYAKDEDDLAETCREEGISPFNEVCGDVP
jgi:hypothetical protein